MPLQGLEGLPTMHRRKDHMRCHDGKSRVLTPYTILVWEEVRVQFVRREEARKYNPRTALTTSHAHNQGVMVEPRRGRFKGP